MVMISLSIESKLLTDIYATCAQLPVVSKRKPGDSEKTTAPKKAKSAGKQHSQTGMRRAEFAKVGSIFIFQVLLQLSDLQQQLPYTLGALVLGAWYKCIAALCGFLCIPVCGTPCKVVLNEPFMCHADVCV